MSAPTTDNVTRPRALGYGVALDDRLFRLAVAPGRELTIETAPLEAPRVNTTSSPEEAGEDFGLVFARSQFDGGAGQFRAHVEGAAPNRFWDSKNVSVAPAESGEFPEIRLLHTTFNIEASGNTGLYTAYDETAGSFYVCDGTILRRSDDPEADVPAFFDDNPHAGEIATTVADVTVLGDEVYAALGVNGIHRKSAGAWAHWNDLQATRIWESKGRIVASDGRSIYEVTSAGVAPSPLKTLAPGLSWQDVVDGGSHVLAAASDGYVYAFSTDTGSLALTAQTLFEGEQPRALGQTQGVIAIGTSAGVVGRLYVGGLAESGQIGDLQLVKTWGDRDDATVQSPRRIIGTRTALYTAVPDGTDTYLWRYDVTTAGIARHLTIDGASGLVRGLNVIGGRLFASVDGSAVYKESDTYAAEGWLIGPLGDFYSSEDKSWVGARLEAGTLASGHTIQLHYTTIADDLNDAESVTWSQAVSRTAGVEDREQSLDSVVDRHLAGMVRLYGDGTSTPSVRSFSFRAFPASGDEEVIVSLPINVSDQIERRGMARRRAQGRGAREYAALKQKEGTSTLLTLYKPDEIIRGLVEYVGTPVQAFTSRGSVTTVSQVRVRGRRVDTSVSSSSAFGIGFFGVEGFG